MRESRGLKWLAALAFALFLPGCSCFRASAGFGLGLGASARVGVLDVGVLGGGAVEWGNAYGLTGRLCAIELGFPLVGRYEQVTGAEEGIERERLEGPLSLYYLLTEEQDDKREYRFVRPTEIAVGLYAGFVSLHVGFEPAALVRLVFGIESPPPVYVEPSPEVIAFTTATPYSLADPPGKLEQIDALLDDPESLVPAPTDRGLLYQSPAVALVASAARGSRDRALLARREEPRTQEALAQALRRRDPDAIAAAIALGPFAPGAHDAARVLGELRLEQGDLDQAIEAFELEETLAEQDDERGDARRRLSLARALREKLAPAPIVEPRGEGVPFGDLTLHAAGDAVWATTVDGEVAWTRSDVLAEGEAIYRAIGGTHELMLIEVGRNNELSVVAVDERGNQRWRARLPYQNWGYIPPATGGDPAPWAYLIGRGRVYFVDRNRVTAIDAATGRVDWFWKHLELLSPGTMPMDRALVPRNHFDGPRARLEGDALIFRTDGFTSYGGEPDRIERLDARTGVFLAAPR